MVGRAKCPQAATILVYNSFNLLIKDVAEEGDADGAKDDTRQVGEGSGKEIDGNNEKMNQGGTTVVQMVDKGKGVAPPVQNG